jgi:hypothetical protein
MSKSKITVLMIFAALVSAAAMVQPRADSAADAARVAIAGPKVASVSGQYRGISLPLHNPDPRHPYEQYIDEIADAGANTIMFTLAGFQENAASSTIFIDVRKVPSDEHLKRLFAHAHSRKLSVVLMPIVLLENPREGEWRGKINPSSWDNWWNSYENFLMHYVYVAAQGQVDVMMVGSELISTENEWHLWRWRKLIKRVRGAFAGKLSYSANWDHYKPVKFWDDLDIVGMTTYYDLTSNGKSTEMDQLLSAWGTIKEQVLDWQATVNRPLMFTEVGWPNQVTCAQFPWDYTRSPRKPDPALQARCFESFFRTWAREEAVAGYIVWEWRSWPEQKTSPEEDTGYSPIHKPAMKVIQQYLTLSQSQPAGGAGVPPAASGPDADCSLPSDN